MDFLANKPKNYIIVGGLETMESIEEVLPFLSSIGQIISYTCIRDLLGRTCLLEVYYSTDEEGKKARFTLNNFMYKQDGIFRVRNYMDAHRETVNERTVVIKNLVPLLTQQQLLEQLSQFGHIVKLEMPMETKNNPYANPYLDRLLELNDKFFADLEKDINVKSLKEKDEMKSKFSFYLLNINRLITEFKTKLSSESADETYKNTTINNLLVEIQFFLKKIMPNEIVNPIIRNELENIKAFDSILSIKKEKEEKTKEAFEKMISNIQNLVKRYEEKMTILSKPVSRDDIPISLGDLQNVNQDPESNITYNPRIK